MGTPTSSSIRIPASLCGVVDQKRTYRLANRRVYSELGVEVREIDLPFDQGSVDSWNTMALAEPFVVHESHLAQNREELLPDVSERLKLGRNIGARDYPAARNQQDEIRHRIATIMNGVDLLAMPTSPIAAVSIATGTVDVAGREVIGGAVLGRLTRMAVLTGQPAISIPCEFTETGFPADLQLVGRWFDEATLPRVANVYEQATS